MENPPSVPWPAGIGLPKAPKDGALCCTGICIPKGGAGDATGPENEGCGCDDPKPKLPESGAVDPKFGCTPLPPNMELEFPKPKGEVEGADPNPAVAFWGARGCEAPKVNGV